MAHAWVSVFKPCQHCSLLCMTSVSILHPQERTHAKDCAWHGVLRRVGRLTTEITMSSRGSGYPWGNMGSMSEFETPRGWGASCSLCLLLEDRFEARGTLRSHPFPSPGSSAGSRTGPPKRARLRYRTCPDERRRGPVQGYCEQRVYGG